MPLGLHGEFRVKRSGRKPLSVLTSLGLHLGLFLLLMEAPPMALPPPSPSEYKQAIEGNEARIVWYRLPEKLPQVNPEAPRKEKRELRADTRSKQLVVSSPRHAQKSPRMVWTEAPTVEVQPLQDSPNLLAVLQRRLPPKPFVTPPGIVRLPLPEIAVPEPPSIPVEMQAMAQISGKLPGKPFTPPVEQRRAPDRQIEIPADAPEVKPDVLNVATILTRLPPKPYIAPERRAAASRQIEVPLDAPQMEARGASVPSLPGSKLPPRPFQPPRQAEAKAREMDIGAPPAIAGDVTKLSVVVVGLNPGTASVPLPAFSNPAAFAGGEKVNPEGATSDGKTVGLAVPDLFVKGTAPERNQNPGKADRGRVDLIARVYAAPTAPETIREALRLARPVAEIPVKVGASGATRVSSAPGSRFNNREVYMMAIQMPNLTSFSGSWLLWYSERTAQGTGLAPIAPPIAHRKVDPKYFADAMEERKEGTVQLFCVIGKDGMVSAVELLKGFDPRLDESAREALAKWEFYPATRQNEPVEVEVVVEIPFRLAPRTTKK